MTTVAPDSGTRDRRQVIELQFFALSALPPNKGMEPTVKSVTPFCIRKGRASFVCGSSPMLGGSIQESEH
jgi:hypothetical protein